MINSRKEKQSYSNNVQNVICNVVKLLTTDSIKETTGMLHANIQNTDEENKLPSVELEEFLSVDRPSLLQQIWQQLAATACREEFQIAASKFRRGILSA